ncbi:dimethyl sulfoxide reductase anchor subunit family protein [Bacillus massiliigorillae]|uniref:dimethyl sulfoxide reductase anchor subunit family protein n=1 Tax=Bacillus massiliigorillae TaxID=1243664 RepID=UPI00039B3F81|nr:DmsC/YnfH family molybdoenzyme membrane anchor subunit [Bacillus massiliigorillae]
MHEWALLILTVAVPAAVGGMLFLWFAQNMLKKNGEDMFKMMKLPLIIIAVVSVIGLIASFFHLGKPIHALNAVRGFGSSWMSNEIVVTGLFIALACITAGLALVQKKINPVLMLITGIVGLADIFCMAQLYKVTRVNGWDHINTYLVFYGTAFTLGPVLGASLLVNTVKGDNLKSITKWAFAIGIFGVAIQLIGTAMFNGYVADMELINTVSASEKLASYSGFIGARWIIEAIGLAGLGYLALSSMKKKVNYSLIYASLVIFLIAEGMSRYFFYVLGA